jgi:hypothetical protein
MPLPMVHLAIAVGIYSPQKSLPPPAFLLGSLAPDAIHMRPDSGRGDKEAVHLGQDPARLRNLLASHTEGADHLPNFAAGYVAHVLADRLWRQTVYPAFLARLPKETAAADLRTLYYRDTDQIDCDLYRALPWRPEVWTLLASAPAIDFPPLLAAAEIARWQERTLAWYDDPDHEPGIEACYIRPEDVHEFIAQASGQIAEGLDDWRHCRER